jgi:hypothetical protein
VCRNTGCVGTQPCVCGVLWVWLWADCALLVWPAPAVCAL